MIASIHARHCVALIILLLQLITTTVVYALEQPSISIHVGSDGLVNVTYVFPVTRGANIVRLPIQPIPETIEVIIGNEKPGFVYGNNTIVLVYEGNASKARVFYVANTSLTNYGLYTVFIDFTGPVEIVIDKNIVMAGIDPPENVENIREYNGTVVVKARGPLKLEYAVMPPVAATSSPASQATTAIQPSATISATTSITPASTATTTTTHYTQLPQFTASTAPATTAESSSLKSATSTSSAINIYTQQAQPSSSPTAIAAQSRLPSLYNYLIYVIIVGAIVATLFLILVVRKGREASEAEPIIDALLDDIDKTIISKLVEKGGAEYQHILQKELGLPKTTMWRRVRRLEKLGFIRVERKGRENYLVLRRNIERQEA